MARSATAAAQRRNVVGVFVEGDVALANMLKNLEPKVFNKIIRKATAKAATPTAKMTRNLVRPVSKTVARAVRKRTKTYRRSGTVVTIVGVSNDPKYTTTETREFGPPRKIVPSKVGHLIEYGTDAHRVPTMALPDGTIIRRNWMHPGTQPVSFIRKAWDSNKGSMVGRIKAALAPGIIREARRLTARGDKSMNKLARKAQRILDEAP